MLYIVTSFYLFTSSRNNDTLNVNRGGEKKCLRGLLLYACRAGHVPAGASTPGLKALA